MMKRGLSTRNPITNPVAAYRERQSLLRSELHARDLDAAVLYCDISSGSDIAYLTHLTLYWSRGLLVIGADGPIAFLPALSPRTEDWFESTGVFDQVLSSTDLAHSLATIIGEHGYRRLGLLERARFPHALLREIDAALEVPGVDLGGLLRDLRVVPDAMARGDLETAAELAADAMRIIEQRLAAGGNLVEACAAAELDMRTAGAWEVVLTRPATANGSGVILRCQLRDAWIATERLFGASPDVETWIEALRAATYAQLRPGLTADALRTALAPHIAGFPSDAAHWEVVLEAAPDIESRPQLGDAHSLQPGMAVHISVAVWNTTGELCALWGDTVMFESPGTIRPLINEE